MSLVLKEKNTFLVDSALRGVAFVPDSGASKLLYSNCKCNINILTKGFFWGWTVWIRYTCGSTFIEPLHIGTKLFPIIVFAIYAFEESIAGKSIFDCLAGLTTCIEENQFTVYIKDLRNIYL